MLHVLCAEFNQRRRSRRDVQIVDRVQVGRLRRRQQWEDVAVLIEARITDPPLELPGGHLGDDVAVELDGAFFSIDHARNFHLRVHADRRQCLFDLGREAVSDTELRPHLHLVQGNEQQDAGRDDRPHHFEVVAAVREPGLAGLALFVDIVFRSFGTGP